MLRPSYSELMEILNKANDMDSQITSRYTIVIAAAKRARQLIDGAVPLTYALTDKAVSTAVKEMQEGLISIKFPEETEPSILIGGMAYNDFDGSYTNENYNVKKNDRDVGIIDYGIDEHTDRAYIHEDEDGLYDDNDMDYNDVEHIDKEDDQEYLDDDDE